MSIAVPTRKRFTDLPGEIRNQIYALLLIETRPRLLSAADSGARLWSRRYSPRQWITLSDIISKLSLNRQLYEEVMSFYFANNEFTLGHNIVSRLKKASIYGLKGFLGRVPEKFVATITRAKLVMTFSERVPNVSINDFSWTFRTKAELKAVRHALDFLSHFKGLQTFIIEDRIVHHTPIYNRSFKPLTLSESVEGLASNIRKFLEDHPECQTYVQCTTDWDAPAYPGASVSSGSKTILKKAMEMAKMPLEEIGPALPRKKRKRE